MGTNARCISTESDKLSEWRKLCNELDIPFSVEDTIGVVI